MTEVEDSTESGSTAGQKTFGMWLKDQRLAKKVPLEEIAAVTKIHLRQLQSLEDGWGDSVPALTIVRGITVAYARHLGLDEVEVVDRFKQHQVEFKSRSSSLIKEAPPATYTPQSGKPLRFGSYSERKDQLKLTHWLSTRRTLYAFFVVLGFGLLLLLMQLGKKSGEEIPLRPSPTDSGVSKQSKSQETKVVDSIAEASSLFTGNPPHEFLIIVGGDVWFSMQIDDQPLVSFKLTSGQTRPITFNRKARVTFSNPLLTKFQIRGVNYVSTAPLGKDETVLFPDQSSKLVVDMPRPVAPPRPIAAPATAPAAIPPSE